MLICFVGTWFLIALLGFATFHMQLQFYELFLARGGEPIPLTKSTFAVTEKTGEKSSLSGPVLG